MSELSQILGSLMVSLVHARRIADEETAAVAEYYKEHPLLEGLSLPRVRVPELTIDMPITIDQHMSETNTVAESPKVIHEAVMDELKKTLDHENILSATRTFQSNFSKEVLIALENVAEKNKAGSMKVSREALVRSVDNALISAEKKSGVDTELTTSQREAIYKQIRHRVSEVSIKEMSRPSGIKASAVSSEVKEKSNPNSGVRLKITLREEGLEWASSSSDGSVRNQLQPE